LLSPRQITFSENKNKCSVTYAENKTLRYKFVSKTNGSYLFTIQTRRPVLLCCLLIEQTISIKPREELNSNIHICKKCSRWKKLTHAWPYIRYSSCISILYIVTTKNEIHELKERLKYRVFSTMINLSFDMNMNTNTNTTCARNGT